MTMKRIGPAYLSSSPTNIFNQSSSLIVSYLKHLHFCNTDNIAVTFTIYIGVTGGSAGGTELFKTMTLQAAGTPGSTYDYYCDTELLYTDYLTGLASVTGQIVITGDVDEEVVP